MVVTRTAVSRARVGKVCLAGKRMRLEWAKVRMAMASKRRAATQSWVAVSPPRAMEVGHKPL